MSSRRFRLAPAFVLGLALGAAAFWFATRPITPVATPALGNHQSKIIDHKSPVPLPFSARADSLRAQLLHLPAASFPRLLDSLSLRCVGADSRADRRLFQIAFDLFVERDPEATSRWAGAHPSSSGLDIVALARQALAAWARLDPDAATRWACALPDEKRSRQIAGVALAALAAQDPDRALALAISASEAFRAAVVPELFAALASTDPGTALRAYGPLLWKQGRGFYQLQGPITDWLRRDPRGAMTWLLAQPHKKESDVFNWLNTAVNSRAPRPELAAAILESAASASRDPVLAQFLFGWSISEPAAALAWLDTVPDPSLRKKLIAAAASVSLGNAPQLSLPLALALPRGADRDQRVADLLGEWAKTAPAAALAWIRRHDAPGAPAAIAKAQAAILGDIARDEPATALAEWRALPEGAAKTAALAPIAASWGRTDPAAALHWLSEQTSDPAEQSALPAALLHAWAKKDPLAALRWSEARPETLPALAGASDEKAPRAATADLYSKITDRSLRVATLAAHLGEWRAKDPAAADTWLKAQTGLSPEETATLSGP